MAQLELSAEVIDDLHEYSVKEEFYKYLEFSAFVRKEETVEYAEKLQKKQGQGDHHYWLIKRRNDRKTIGTFGLCNIDDTRRSVELGYGLSPDCWGKGYFKEMLSVILPHLFIDKSFERVWAVTHEENHASIHGLKKCGFVQEGILRHFYYSLKAQSFNNAVLLSMIKEDFIGSSYKK